MKIDGTQLIRFIQQMMAANTPITSKQLLALQKNPAGPIMPEDSLASVALAGDILTLSSRGGDVVIIREEQTGPETQHLIVRQGRMMDDPSIWKSWKLCHVGYDKCYAKLCGFTSDKRPVVLVHEVELDSTQSHKHALRW